MARLEVMSQQKPRCSDKDWREIAAEAANETDPEKLGRIIKELCDALDKSHPQNRVPGDMLERKSA